MVYPTTLRSLQRTSRLLSDNLPSSPAASSSSSIYQRAASSLLPPLPLYRRLLRAHRTKLSYEMRSLGDTYLRDEFRRHRSVTNPLQVVGFLGGWKIYLDQLEGELDGGIAGATTGEGGNKRFFEGRKLSAEEFEKVRPGRGCASSRSYPLAERSRPNSLSFLHCLVFILAALRRTALPAARIHDGHAGPV